MNKILNFDKKRELVWRKPYLYIRQKVSKISRFIDILSTPIYWYINC